MIGISHAVILIEEDTLKHRHDKLRNGHAVLQFKFWAFTLMEYKRPVHFTSQFVLSTCNEKSSLA